MNETLTEAELDQLENLFNRLAVAHKGSSSFSPFEDAIKALIDIVLSCDTYEEAKSIAMKALNWHVMEEEDSGEGERHLTREEQLGMERALRASGKPSTPPKDAIGELIEHFQSEECQCAYRKKAANALKQLKASDEIGRKLLAGRDKQITAKDAEIDEVIADSWRLEGECAAKNAEIAKVDKNWRDREKFLTDTITAKDAEMKQLADAWNEQEGRWEGSELTKAQTEIARLRKELEAIRARATEKDKK